MPKHILTLDSFGIADYRMLCFRYISIQKISFFQRMLQMLA